MSTFVYMTRCDGCGHCVDICPSDIMHIDENIRGAVNIEPNFCWECYSCVKGHGRTRTGWSKIIILSWFIVFIRLNLRSSMMAGSEIRVADYQKLRPITIII